MTGARGSNREFSRSTSQPKHLMSAVKRLSKQKLKNGKRWIHTDVRVEAHVALELFAVEQLPAPPGRPLTKKD